MEVLEQMRMLLREKAILFGQYEQETLRLDTDDLDAVDDIVDAVQARQALIDKINGLDRRIAAIGEASAYGARCFPFIRSLSVRAAGRSRGADTADFTGMGKDLWACLASGGRLSGRTGETAECLRRKTGRHGFPP